MKRRPRNTRLIAEINIVPFTDVILVLLIIFMVATPFIYRSSLKISLPKVSTQDTQPPTKDIQITISASGDILLGQENYNIKKDADVLRFKIKQLAQKDKNTSIVINGDKNAKYDIVVAVIDMATSAGISQLVLATEFKR